jgi:hypothetical protein
MVKNLLKNYNLLQMDAFVKYNKNELLELGLCQFPGLAHDLWLDKILLA